MTLRLSIENVDRLPDGGPVRIEVKGRGLDLGRDSHLDWTLPDPGRSISGKHCEIRYRDGGYWLHDVSTNGTFVNGAEYRLDAPHLLRDGDRLGIGPYIIAVSVEEGRKRASPVPAAAGAFDAGLANVWGPVGRGRSAGNRRQAPGGADARRSAGLSRFCFVPRGAESRPGGAASPPRSEDDWLTAISSAPRLRRSPTFRSPAYRRPRGRRPPTRRQPPASRPGRRSADDAAGARSSRAHRPGGGRSPACFRLPQSGRNRRRNRRAFSG